MTPAANRDEKVIIFYLLARAYCLEAAMLLTTNRRQDFCELR